MFFKNDIKSGFNISEDIFNFPKKLKKKFKYFP